MRDFKYTQLVTNPGQWDTTLKNLLEVKSKCLLPCAMAFHANMKRTEDFARFPAGIALGNRRDICCLINAIHRITGKTDLTLRQLVEFDLTPDVFEEMMRQNREFISQDENTLNKLLRRSGMEIIDGYGKQDPNMSSSLDALMTSIVLESWLFFEAFASDLWAAGVDNGKSKIQAALAAAKFHGKQPKYQPPDSTMKALGTQQGSYRVEKGLVTFQSIKKIGENFKAIFGQPAMDALDNTAEGYTYALSSTRNCIVHKSGWVDHEFKRDAVSRFGEFSHLEIRDRILLDGELVKKLRNAAAETGLALLHLADASLENGD